MSTPSRERLGGKTWLFRSWSDGGAATHVVRSSATPQTFTALYDPETIRPVSPARPVKVVGSRRGPP